MNKRLYDLVSNYKPYCEEEKIDKEIILDFIEKYDDVTTRDNKIAHFTTSAWITNKDRTKILMIHHNIYNSWAWVGGHADGDDDLLYVVKKEIEEETGLTNVELLSNDIFGLNIITVDHHYKHNKYVSSHLHFDVEYVFVANELDKLSVKEDENSGVKWVLIDEVNNYTTEEKMKPIYSRLNERLKKL